MTNTSREIRFGLRALKKDPGLTTAAILAFALGIGANAAIFSVVYAVLLRPLAYRDPGSLVVLEHAGPSPVAPATFLDWRAQAHSFTDMAAAQAWGGSLRRDERPEAISGLSLTANMFAVLGVPAMLGRTFLPDEDQPGHPSVVVLSYSLWRREFGARDDVLGRQIVIDGKSYTIVGVMPASFRFAPFWVTDAEIWTPLVLGPGVTDRDGASLRVFARLKSKTSVVKAKAEMDAIMSRLAHDYPSSSAKLTVAMTPLNEKAVGKVRQMLLVLLGAVGFVLLIACSNVANLMLARASARSREIAVRLALGASRWHIARQSMTESALLSALGGVAGLFLASAGVALIRAMLPAGAMPRQDELGLDSMAVFFTFVLALICGMVSGMIPAWQSSKSDVNDALKQGGRTGTSAGGALRARSLLIAGETTLAFLLLAGAGLLLHSFARLLSLDPGFRPENLVTMEVSVAGTHENEGHRRALFYKLAIDKIAAIAGVTAVSAINHVPIEGDVWGTRFRVDGEPMPRPGEFPNAVYRVIEPGYFHAMQTPILSGRDFTQRDSLDASRVVIVNESLAWNHWPPGEAIGKRIIAGRPDEGLIPLTVVGIVHDVKQRDWQALPQEELYFPFLQSRDFLEDPASHVASMWFVIRTVGDAFAMSTSIERAIHSIDSNVLVSGATSMESAIARDLWRQRLSLFLLAAFALVALALAVTGIYGVVSHAVSQRTQEMGIRMALGAERRDILLLAVQKGMKPVWIGGLFGLGLALILGRLMTAMLFEVKPADPMALLSAMILLPLAGLLANGLPAWRASRVDPLAALRQE